MGEQRHGKRASVGLGVAVLIAIVGFAATAFGLSINTGQDQSYHLKAHFPTANGLITGSDIFFGGVKVGTVTDLAVDPDSHGATVTMSIGKDYAPVHDGATALIRPKSLLGEKYVAVTVGDPGKDALPDGATLPQGSTDVNVELDQLINVFDAPTRQQLRTLIQQVGDGLAGQGANTNQAFQVGQQDLSHLSTVTDVLQQRDAELKRIIDALTKLTATLSSDQQRNNYVDLLKHSQTVLTALKAEDADVQQGIDRMNLLFGEFDKSITGRSGDLAAIFADLPTTLTDLNATSLTLSRQAATALPLVREATPGTIGAPIIFGSQPANADKIFTQNVFTRVQTSQGCFSVNGRTTDAQGFVHDNPPPPINATLCTVPAPILACLLNPTDTTACPAAILAQICSIPQVGPIIPLCPPPPHAATSGATSPAAAGGYTPTIQDAVYTSPAVQQAQASYLDYLLR